MHQPSFKARISLQQRTPLFTLDYLKSPSSTSIPSSHYNIYAERGDIVWAMAASGTRHRGKARKKKLDEARQIPMLRDLYFPTGGRRFRPSVEDFLEFLINE